MFFFSLFFFKSLFLMYFFFFNKIWVVLSLNDWEWCHNVKITCFVIPYSFIELINFIPLLSEFYFYDSLSTEEFLLKFIIFHSFKIIFILILLYAHQKSYCNPVFCFLIFECKYSGVHARTVLFQKIYSRDLSKKVRMFFFCKV